jgi:hypothetical protein
MVKRWNRSNGLCSKRYVPSEVYNLIRVALRERKTTRSTRDNKRICVVHSFVAKDSGVDIFVFPRRGGGVYYHVLCQRTPCRSYVSDHMVSFGSQIRTCQRFCRCTPHHGLVRHSSLYTNIQDCSCYQVSIFAVQCLDVDHLPHCTCDDGITSCMGCYPNINCIALTR